MIIAAFLNAVTTLNVFTASNNDVTLVKTKAVHFNLDTIIANYRWK